MIRIKEVIKEKGLTVAEVAERINENNKTKNPNLVSKFHQTSLSRIINGGNPTLEMLEKISKALDVPITELFAEKSTTESELLGVIRYKGIAYKIDSVEELMKLVKDVEPVVKD